MKEAKAKMAKTPRKTHISSFKKKTQPKMKRKKKMKTATNNERGTKMSKQATLIEVGVFDNSSDWGTVGTYKTERGAIREARKFARAHSSQTGYDGYGPTIRLQEVDAATGEAVSPTWDVRAW